MKLYNTRYFCPYSQLPQRKLPRHLDSQYANEEVVKLTYPGAERQKILNRLWNLGAHRNNNRVLREGKGEMLVAY